MLNLEQLSDLKNTKRDMLNKALIINTAIDIQALLRLLAEKEIITKAEMNRLREEVRSSPKYANAVIYLDQTLNEIKRFENDPQALLREIMQRKMGK